MIHLAKSYFAIPDLGDFLEKYLHPYRYSVRVNLDGHPIQVNWTRRAQQALAQRNKPLIADMQLYFSCVVKKRVLFSDTQDEWGCKVNDNLFITFRAVQSQSCDPEEFARNHPVKQEFQSRASTKMRAKTLKIDCRKGEWQGQFFI